MNSDPELIDLGDYFPDMLPLLVADLWSDALEQAFTAQVHNIDGRLYASGSLMLRETMPPQLATPQAAADYWRASVEPELLAAAKAIRADDEEVDVGEAAQNLLKRWHTFIRWYFLNPAAAWIEQSREEAGNSAAVVGRSARVRRRQSLLEELAASNDASAGSATPSSLLQAYLDEFGAYSPHPDDFSQAYPRDDPLLLAREIRLVARGIAGPDNVSSTTVESTTADTSTAWSALVSIAEEDNHYKYEACYALRHQLLGLGERLVASGRLASTDAIWQLSVAELTGTASVPARPVRSVSVAPLNDASTSASVLAGQAIVAGDATGTAWKVTGDDDPPDGPIVLVTDGLGSIHAGSLLPYAQGLIARYGGPTSHCALIAREVGCPVIVLGDNIDRVRDGDQLALTRRGDVIIGGAGIAFPAVIGSVV